MLGRIRYQLLLVLTVSIVAPALLQQFAFSGPRFLTVQSATIIGGATALILGYSAYRRLLVFPGISAAGYGITSMTVTFGILTAALILFRIDYSRWQLLASYMLAVGCVLFLHLKVERRRNFVIGYLAGGRTRALPALYNVIWRPIERPDERLEGVIHSVIADLRHEREAAWDSAIAAWVLAGIPVHDTRTAIEQLTGRVEINHISENTLGSLNPNAVLLKAKSVVDFLISLVALVACAPAMMLIAALIRLDSPGPAIFRQTRTGFRAQPFIVYKFRTMRLLNEAVDEDTARKLAITQSDDSRITRIGKFLRRTRLDELPQLFNILKGQMSLIGPRPEAVSLSRWYEKEIPFYHYRHIIKPGLTGWAQVNQGHVTDVEQIREKLHLDFYYVKNYSFWLDFLILLRTLTIVVSGNGAR